MNLNDAIATMNAIHALPDDNLDIHMTIRSLLIDDSTDYLPAADHAPLIRAAIRSLDDDALSTMRLEYSLCPLHATDYAICFDDDDPECSQIRQIFPSHDT